MWRWLSAEARDVVDLAGPGTLAGGNEELRLGEELRRWRGIVGRRRLVALLRRHLAVALALAALLEILAQVDALPQWAVVAAPAALYLVSVASFAARGPSPSGLARLFDEKLGLNDRLSTALEIEARGGARSPLEARTVADAAALLRAGAEDWHARAARGGRDWWVLAAPIAAIAVVVGIGSLASSGGSSGGAGVAIGPGGSGAGGGPNEAGRRKREAEEGRRKGSNPNGGRQGQGGNPPEASSEPSAEAGYRQIPQGKAGKAREAGKAGKGAAGAGRAPSGDSSQGSGGGEAGKGRSRPAGGSGDQKEREESTLELSVEGESEGGKTGQSAPVPGAPGSKGSSPRGPGAEAAAGDRESGSKKGAPGGSGEAGGESGSDSPGHTKRIEGGASEPLKIQPGYAPSRASKGGAEGKRSGDRQGGGGKARTGEVTGATQVGEEFSFVPATGGAVPGAATGLQQNYAESLKWVERLPW